MIKTNLP